MDVCTAAEEKEGESNMFLVPRREEEDVTIGLLSRMVLTWQ